MENGFGFLIQGKLEDKIRDKEQITSTLKDSGVDCKVLKDGQEETVLFLRIYKYPGFNIGELHAILERNKLSFAGKFSIHKLPFPNELNVQDFHL